MVGQDLQRYLVLWGPGILILFVFAYGFLKLARHWIDRAMEVKRGQMESAFGIARDYVAQLADAHRAQADALSRLASTAERRDSLESYEHQEMLVALKAIHRNVESLVESGTGTRRALRT